MCLESLCPLLRYSTREKRLDPGTPKQKVEGRINPLCSAVWTEATALVTGKRAF